jgi:hypothetical protein
MLKLVEVMPFTKSDNTREGCRHKRKVTTVLTSIRVKNILKLCGKPVSFTVAVMKSHENVNN